MRFVECELDRTKLPTKLDVMQHLLFLRSGQTVDGVRGNVSIPQLFMTALADVFQLYARARIPIASKPSAWFQINAVFKRYKDVMKNPVHYDEREWRGLLMICACKCGVEIGLPCNCDQQKRIPLDVQAFFVDQCRLRLLTFDSSPVHAAAGVADLISASGSGVRHDTLSSAPGSRHVTASSAGYVPLPSEFDEFETTQAAQFPSPDIDEATPFNVAGTNLRNFCAALDRAGVSSRFGALLATMLLLDLNIQGLIIDYNKIKRERVKARAQAIADMRCNDLLKGISFDGKKEKTLKQKVVNGRPRNVKVKEEHITMVKEPGSKYIGYATPAEPTGHGIMSSMVDMLATEEISLDNLVVAGCDGTSLNTGNRSGAVTLLEQRLNRPLQWFVCLFHFNDLPFKALLKELLGKPKSAKKWPGKIGRKLLYCEDIPVRLIHSFTNFYSSTSMHFIYSFHYVSLNL